MNPNFYRTGTLIEAREAGILRRRSAAFTRANALDQPEDKQ
jgi:hypothetical protein